MYSVKAKKLNKGMLSRVQLIDHETGKTVIMDAAKFKDAVMKGLVFQCRNVSSYEMHPCYFVGSMPLLNYPDIQDSSSSSTFRLCCRYLDHNGVVLGYDVADQAGNTRYLTATETWSVAIQYGIIGVVAYKPKNSNKRILRGQDKKISDMIMTVIR